MALAMKTSTARRAAASLEDLEPTFLAIYPDHRSAIVIAYDDGISHGTPDLQYDERCFCRMMLSIQIQSEAGSYRDHRKHSLLSNYIQKIAIHPRGRIASAPTIVVYGTRQ
jgi:hypothetical protein